MASFCVETFVLPSHWASYFINADPSGAPPADPLQAGGQV